MSTKSPPEKLTPDWTLDDVLTTLGKISSRDLIYFLKSQFPEEDLESWDHPSLLELALSLIQTWEEASPTQEEFLIQATSSLCKSSFEAFVRLFWDEVPIAQPLLWNWNIGVYTAEIQEAAEQIFTKNPRSHDLICNVSPGCSKSSVWSVLFPCWVWTRMPEARLITASHTDILVTDLAAYARDVMKGVKYRILFPEIDFTESQDSKGYYRNTLGGERFTCTVAGKSPTGHHAHFIICLPGDSRITTDKGLIPISRIVEEKMSVKVLGYDHFVNRLVWKEIEEYESSPGRQIGRLVFSDGTQVEATDDHPIFIKDKGYISLGNVAVGDRVNSVPGWYGKTVSKVELSVRLPEKVYNLKVEGTHNYFAEGILLHNCDDPIDPKKVLSEAERKTAGEFLTQVIPSRRMRGARGDTCVTMLVTQRLGIGDPTDVMLSIAKKEGAYPVRHICLPAELTDRVSPPELRHFYTDFNVDAGVDPQGLMDPVRLGRRTLDDQRATLGEYGYVGQYLQAPRPLEGGLFKEIWFSRRVPAAPYRCRRIRYYDRAASTGSMACATAGVLMSYDGERLFVENVVYGRWEPDGRNAVMVATAQRDRLRYGKYEPIIHVEAEGGSSGRDAWLGIVRALMGFHVREDIVRGSKDTRAEPWATQLSAGNVFIVDNGASSGIGTPDWDIDGYVTDHCNFRPEPGKKLGREKDRIDASCLVAGTMVSTERGLVPIEEVREGDYVYTRDGLCKVTWAGCSGYVDELVSVTFSNGSTLTGTYEHLVWTQGRGFIKMGELESTDVVVSFPSKEEDAPCRLSYSVVSYVPGGGRISVYDLMVEGSHEFFANGVLVHNSGAFNLLVGLKRTYPILRTYRIDPSDRSLTHWIIVCSADEVNLVDLSDNRVLLITFSDPPTTNTVERFVIDNGGLPGGDNLPVRVSPRAKSVSELHMNFVDMSPEDHQATWDQPIQPWNKPIAELQLSRDQAKKLWSFILCQRDQPWQVLLLVDETNDNGRALSAAMAIADIMNMPRSSIYRPGEDTRDIVDEEAPNMHIFSLLKLARHLVIS